jgi:hypothetical protein
MRKLTEQELEAAKAEFMDKVAHLPKNEQLAVGIVLKYDGSLAPTLKRKECDGYWFATHANLNDACYKLAEKGILVKDFMAFVPKGQIKEAPDGRIMVNIGGRQVARKQNEKTGEISEAIFYVPFLIPEWVQRRRENREEAKNLGEEYKRFLNLLPEPETTMSEALEKAGVVEKEIPL